MQKLENLLEPWHIGTQQELSNEYQHAMVYMVFKDLGICLLCMKVATALKG